MIIRSVQHRGLKRLIEDNQTKGLRPDLVNRIRNIVTALILAEDMGAFRGSAPPGWRGAPTLRRSERYLERVHLRKLADHL